MISFRLCWLQCSRRATNISTSSLVPFWIYELAWSYVRYKIFIITPAQLLKLRLTFDNYLWNKICNNENLTSNITRTRFCKNLKESLLTGLNLVCNNNHIYGINVIKHKYRGLIVLLSQPFLLYWCIYSFLI